MPARPLAKIFRGTPRNLDRLARALITGDVVAVPTETVYGLAGDALNEKAVEKIFRAKGRPANDPLIVHIHALSQLNQLAETNAAVEKIARAFWPGPLTIVLPKKSAVPDLVTSGRPSVAIRMPRHPLFRTLLRACGRPLAAPSANPFGYVSPTSSAHVFDGLGKKIRYILEGGDCVIGLESTILDLRDPKCPAILRPGAVERQEIERVLRVKVKPAASEIVKRSQAAVAPGLLARHYSPRTPIKLYSQLSEGRDGPPGRPPTQSALGVADAPAVRPYPRSTDAYLFFRRPAEFAKGRVPKNIFWLSADGEPAVAAKSLFALLRALDRGKWKQIHAERAPGDSALALAINDRLTRAAAKR